MSLPSVDLFASALFLLSVACLGVIPLLEFHINSDSMAMSDSSIVEPYFMKCVALYLLPRAVEFSIQHN